ncbi:MAG: anhydro-N-acetylmuramic acid kinase [Oxalobacter sp.]|nr:anhydro-N-acetylmuramic acid kinase [Oxalobacter sp.]
MTGTSMDGVDGVLVEIPDNYTGGFLPLTSAAHIPFNEDLRRLLMSLQLPSDNEIEREALVANDLANIYARCVFRLLEQSCLTPGFVTAIGVHGQTIRHRPELGYTRQTNNPALLAELTGIDVIADFRSRDLAAGGQGAPLVPAFHHALFGNSGNSCVVVNIGGIANISILTRDRKTIGFDTGPGNVLLDAWIAKYQGLLYDENGQWAASGEPDSELLAVMLKEPFLSLPPPKSTGRDLFNEEWVEAKLASALEFTVLSPVDIQATLAAFTITTIADAITRYAPDADKIFICGGGARNTHLVSGLEAALEKPMPDTDVVTSEVIGIDPTHIEGLAFAWLAHRFTNPLPGNLPGVTGAHGPRILGALYPGMMDKDVTAFFGKTGAAE